MSEDMTLGDFDETIQKDAEEDAQPELFGIGKIPNDWKIETLSELVEIIPGNSPPSSTYNRDGEGLPFFQGNSEFGYFHPQADTWCNEPRKEALADDILMSIRAPVGDLNIADRRCCIGRGLAALRPRELNGLYLFYHLAIRRGWLSRLATGSTFKAVTKGDLQRLDIPTPSREEQEKIVSVLYNIDQAIQKTGEIIEQAERVKQGVVQELFTYGLDDSNTQSIHVGEFPDYWEFEKLSEVTNIVRGDTPDTSNGEYYSGDIPWVTPDDLSTLYEEDDGKYIRDTRRKLTEEGAGSASLRVVDPNSVMFTSRSYGIGKTAICTVPAATNQGITAFECGNRLYEEFLYYYLDYIMDYIISISGVSTFPEISKSDTGNIDVPVPDIEEQEEIASKLGDIDYYIAHEKRTQNSLERLKRGLMQDLLTGEVRTNDADIEIPEEVSAYG